MTTSKARSHCVRRHLHVHQKTFNALALNWSWARDVNGRDRDETETSAFRNRDVDNFSRDETETRRWYVTRPSRDQDVETETTRLEKEVPRFHGNTVVAYRPTLTSLSSNSMICVQNVPLNCNKMLSYRRETALHCVL